ncbi:MAG: hypothetical protein HOF33_18875 [Rhodospirillaceae bacterium]|jgi:hypothetical protein|nr:hypothetical protein [Rhodospirillaceae bacterium]
MKRTLIALFAVLAIAGASPAFAQIENWSTDADNNNSAPPNGAPEGMAPSGMNNTVREGMAQVRRLAEQSISGIFGAITGETPNAYRITPFIAPTTGSTSDLPLGAMYWFQAATDNSGAVTLQVSGYTAAAIQKKGETLASGDIVSGDFVGVIYDGNAFQIISEPRLAGVAFLVNNSSTDSNVTGDGTAATVDLNNEIYDYGNNFAGDTFTAPAPGLYHFDGSTLMADVNNGTTHSTVRLELVTTKRVYMLSKINGNTAASGNELFVNGGITADMAKGDTATLRLNVSGGTKIVEVVGSGMETYLSGFRVQ